MPMPTSKSKFMKVKPNTAAERYERIVLDYFAAGGLALAVTDDLSFSRILKFTLTDIKLDYKVVYRETSKYDDAVTFASKVVDRLSAPLLIFLERRIRNRSCLKPVKVLKNFYGDRVRLFVVSGEVSKAEILLAHEIGADSFVTKPISANALIEKIAFAIKPNNKLGVLLDRAASLIASGDLDLAERVAAKAFEIKPDSLKGHLLMGDVAMSRGNYAKAEKHYIAAGKAEKVYIEPLGKLVNLSRKSGDTNKLLTYLNHLDRLSPLNFERKMEIGEVYLDRGDTEKASSYFEEARRVVGKVAADLVSDSLVEIAAKIGEKDEAMALRFITEAIETKGSTLTREDLWMFNKRGILLRRQGDWTEAVENYRKALLIAPNDPGLLYNLGVAYAEGKDQYRAVDYFEKALELDPTLPRQDPQVAYNLASANHRCRNMEDARKYLAIALELDPEYEPAKRLKGYIS